MNKGLGLLLSVVLVALGAGAGRLAGPFLARADDTVQLSHRIHIEDEQGLEERTLESEAFRDSGRATQDLHAEARAVAAGFVAGGTWLGAVLGLLLAVRILWAQRVPQRDEYEIDRAECVCCARCFLSCPREHLRRKLLAGEIPDDAFFKRSPKQ
jgi:hypothetical protein